MLKSVFFFMKIQIIVSMVCNVFKHEFNPESIITEELVEDILTVYKPSETINHDNVNINSTFNKPYQIGKVANEETFQCKKYDFDSKRKTYINDHKMTNQNWC